MFENTARIAAAIHPIDALGDLLKTSGNSLRLRILRVLASDAYSVSELCRIFDIRQSAISHHLAILSEARLITARRDGTLIFYRRNCQSHHSEQAELRKTLFAELDRCPLETSICTGIHAVMAERDQIARRFFAGHCKQFCINQELIAPPKEYLPAITEMIDQTKTAGKRHIALEIGSGDGNFLPTLAARFPRVIAVDSSKEMIASARRNADKSGLGGVHFLHGNSSDIALHNLNADAAVINMVLHHTPSPASVFRDCAKAMTSGGHLYISEICHHNQEWVRAACGDLWLGFSPDELNLWATQANFSHFNCQILGMRNGFQIQIRHFILNEQ